MSETRPGRPNRVVLDAGAFRRNLKLVRALLPPATGIWQVCKGDGYGLGVLSAAAMGIDAGLRDFCVGTPDEALALRAAHPSARILLFPSVAASDLPELSLSGITLTVHNTASLRVVLEQASAATFLFKVNTGLNRFGFDMADWRQALAALKASRHEGLLGIYTHFGQSMRGATQEASIALFRRFLNMARTELDRPVPAMAVASPALFDAPMLPFEWADPGRALYGMLPLQEAGGHVLTPVVREISSRLIDSRQLAPGADTIGYEGRAGRPVTRIGTIPLGHFDGLPVSGPLGSVLIRGCKVAVLARTLLASIIDLSNVPDARDGDRVILVGRDGGEVQDLFEFATGLGTSATLLHFGFIRNLPKSIVEPGRSQYEYISLDRLR